MHDQSSSPDSFQTFGDFLKYLRRREHLTQLELSIAVGYSDAQITRLEKNQRRPDLAALKALFIPALNIENEPELVQRFLDLAQSAREEVAPVPGIAPYKGLLFFDDSDTEIFFGREALTAHLAQRVTNIALDSSSRFLAVVGASGSGKSSLVRAGVAVALQQAGWDLRIFTPGSDPSRALEIQLELDQHGSEVDRLLIVVDQFEEAFTLCREDSQRVLFIERLLDLARKPERKVFVLIALRADFYSHCAQYPSLRQAVAAEQDYIGQMNLEELLRAIEEPARRSGWDFEPGLVDVLLNDIGAHGASEPEPGALPLLSHALLATWERRRGRLLTLDGYQASGGVRGAIAETAESVFTDSLNQTQQDIARDVFLRLTELGEGTEDTRRRATLNELVRQSAEATQLRGVLNTLAEARLITLNEESAEVAHEALIREWQRLHTWLTQDRESLLLHRHLTESAYEWQRRGQDPSELYRGARLAQAQEWASANKERLNTLEGAFLSASIEHEERAARDREAQRRRELEAAKKLAEAQTQAAKRLRRRAISLAGVLFLAVALAGVAIFLGNQANRNALAAQSRELAAAAISSLDDDPERSILLALQAVSKTHTVEAENALHASILVSRVLLVLRHDAEVWGVDYSPDGKRIATASQDGTARVWDGTTGELLLTLKGHRESVNSVTYSPDGKRIATGSQDGTAKVWDAATGRLLLTLSGHSESVHSVAFSLEGKRLATASDDGSAKVWDVGTGEELLTLSGQGGAVFDVAFSPDGARIATSGLDLHVRVWDVASGDELLALPFENGDQIRGLAFSPDGTRIAVTSTRFPWGRVWDAVSGEALLSGFPDHRDALLDIAFSKDGKLVATGGADTKSKVRDPITGEVLLTLSGHTLPITHLVFDPAGTRLVTVSWDYTARVWDLTPARESLFIPVQSPWSLRTSYSPDGTRILGDSPPDNTARVWDATSGEEILTLNGEAGSSHLTAYSPDGKLVAGSSDRTIIVFDAGTGTEQFRLAGHTDAITSMDFSADGIHLASGSANGEIMIWDLAAGRDILTLQGPTIGSSPLVRYAIFAVAFSPDGKHLVSGDTYGQGLIWDTTTGEKLVTIIHEEAIGNASFPDIGFDAAYSPDGKTVAITGGLGTTRIWDAFTGQELLTLKGHTGPVVSVTFSSDGKWVATASRDGSAKVWDAATGLNTLTLAVDSQGAGGVSFRPDGKRLAVGAVSGVYIYVLPLDELVELARSRLTRTLTLEECKRYLHVAACPVE